MKKFSIVICFLLAVVLFQAFRGAGFTHGDSVLRPNVSIITMPKGLRVVAFFDEETSKVGLLSNDSHMTVCLPPTYDSADNNGTKLLPVLKDGKWGVIDLACRYYVPGAWYTDPIIPCIYKHITIENDNVAICDGKRIDITKLGYEE